jgi:hypothetical protein
MTRHEVIRLCEMKLLKLKHRYTRFLEDKNMVYRRGFFRQKMGEDQCVERTHYLKLLPEILYALDRIKNGQFGLCQETGQPIDPQKLISTPWIRYSHERG